MSDSLRSLKTNEWPWANRSLRSLRGNERPWANRSGRLRQMSDPERFAQAAQRKWGNEWFAQKMFAKKVLNLVLSMFYIRFFFFKLLKNERIDNFRSAPLLWWAIRSRSLISSEQCEQCEVAQQKLAIVSESLRSLTKNELPWVICSYCSEEMSNRERIAKVAHQ